MSNFCFSSQMFSKVVCFKGIIQRLHTHGKGLIASMSSTHTDDCEICQQITSECLQTTNDITQLKTSVNISVNVRLGCIEHLLALKPNVIRNSACRYVSATLF